MSNTKTIDAKGQPCPQPVILAKNALAKGGFDVLEVIVDNAASAENVARFIAYAGHTLEKTEENDSNFHVIVKVLGEAKTVDIPDELNCALPQTGGAKTVFIHADKIGRGKDDLGALLMRGFMFTLTEMDKKPARIILMNGGVTLAVEGAETLDNLTKLEQAGVEVIACGTCLEFYNLKDKLAVGKISNMYEITEFLMSGDVVTI